MATVNGHSVTPTHMVEFNQSQQQRTVVIGGTVMARVPHDRHDPCSCHAAQSQLHHVGCQSEQCPSCGWLLHNCGCLNGD